MAIRGFNGIQTIGAASQPLFGTTISAVTSFIPDQYSGDTTPGSNQSLFTCTLASAVGFRKGDIVVVGPKANFVYQGALDVGFVYAVNVGTGVVTIQGLSNPHIATEYVLLHADVAQVFIEPVVTTGKLYVGSYSTVAAGDASVFDVIPVYGGTGAMPYYHQTVSGDRFNPFKTSEYWLNGTSTDTFIARFMEF
jgi:hypothetical protein